MKSLWKTLLLSTVIVNLIVGSGIYVYRISLQKRLKEWTIKQVLERGQGELPSGFFAEALDLSQDKPLSWDLFDTKRAEKRLLAYPFFKRVKVGKIEPNAALVDYVLRQPLVKVADQANSAMDEEGVIFPLEPYYSPKKLPSVRFGGLASQAAAQTAFRLMNEIKTAPLPPRILFIDLSLQNSPVLGRQKIVVMLEEQLFQEGHVKKQPVLLQLSAHEPLDSLERWKAMRPLLLQPENCKDSVKEKGIIVDLRQANLAYLH